MMVRLLPDPFVRHVPTRPMRLTVVTARQGDGA